MNEFYNLLSTSSNNLSPYLNALNIFTKIGRSQLLAIAGDLGWQAW
jgi:hypothetical protein